MECAQHIKPFTTEELMNKIQKNRNVENDDNIEDMIEIATEYQRNLKNIKIIKGRKLQNNLILLLNVRGKADYYIGKLKN